MSNKGINFWVEARCDGVIGHEPSPHCLEGHSGIWASNAAELREASQALKKAGWRVKKNGQTQCPECVKYEKDQT